MELLGITRRFAARFLALSGGDARKMLNANLRCNYRTRTRYWMGAQPRATTCSGCTPIRIDAIEAAYGRKASRGRRALQYHQRVFIKRMRGSDPNAALYWCPHDRIRRGLRVYRATHDISPAATSQCRTRAPAPLMACWDAVRAVGYPEATIIFWAGFLSVLANKSNASCWEFCGAQKRKKIPTSRCCPLTQRN